MDLAIKVRDLFIGILKVSLLSIGMNEPSNLRQSVLLCSLPRSGSTWIGKILDSHRQTLYLHEPDSQFRVPCLPMITEISESKVWGEFARLYIDRLNLFSTSRTRGKRPIFKKDYDKLQIGRTKILASIIAEKLCGGRTFKIACPQKANHLSRVITIWKSIESTGRIPTFVREIPSLQVLHLVRHPCGFIASVLQGEKHRLFTKTFNVNLSDDAGIFKQLCSSSIGKKYDLSLQEMMASSKVSRLAWYWRVLNETAALSCGSPNYALVNYDKLHAATEENVTRLFHTINMNLDKSVRDFLRRSTSIQKNSYYSVFKGKNQSEKWRTSLTVEQVNQIMSIVGESTFYRENYSN